MEIYKILATMIVILLLVISFFHFEIGTYIKNINFHLFQLLTGCYNKR